LFWQKKENQITSKQYSYQKKSSNNSCDEGKKQGETTLTNQK